MFGKKSTNDRKKIHTICVSPYPRRRSSLTSAKSLKDLRMQNLQRKISIDNGNSETLGLHLRSMVETSSIHGVSHVFSAGSRHRRVLWIIFILSFLGYFLFQLHGILTYYKSYPIKTSVTLQSRPLPFPAVTICNINPVKMSKVSQMGTRTMKRLMDIQGELNTSQSQPLMTRSVREGLLSLARNMSADRVYNLNTFSDLGVHDDWLSQHRQLEIEDKIGVEAYEQLGELDGLYVLYQTLQQEFISLPRKRILAMGHGVEQMLIRCTMAGTPCVWPSRTHVYKEYGTCYTLESPKYITTKSGPEYGLQMTLNLENHEAMPEVLSGHGARLVIHQPGSFPLPAEEGITISAGYETSLGIRMTKIERLGQPHGTCVSPSGFKTLDIGQDVSERVRYSKQVCLLECKEITIENVCKCFLSNIRVELSSRQEYGDLLHCSHSAETFRCAVRVTQDFLVNKRSCNCHNECNETIYSRFFSGRLWPSTDYLDDLVEIACSKYGAQNYKCPLELLSTEEKRLNFLKINIYYEDLNFEYLSEEPEYELMNLLSDIGGSLGLFLGASVLSMCELLEILVEVIYFVIMKKMRKS